MLVIKDGGLKNEIPPYDQQPVDAASVTLACLQAFVTTGEKQYIEMAQTAYDWYWGKTSIIFLYTMRRRKAVTMLSFLMGSIRIKARKQLFHS